MIKTVIFDIDGTMYDYEAANAVAMEALRRYCAEQFGVDEACFGRTFKEADALARERIGGAYAAIHNRLIRYQIMLEQLGQPLFPHARNMYHIYWDTLLEVMRPCEGIREWMQLLKREGVRIGVGSNMTAYIQYKKLEKLELSPYIDWIVTSEEAGCEKPAQRFFEQCAAKSGMLPQECLFVGDSLKSDVKGALAAGMSGLLYAPGKDRAAGLPYIRIGSYTECLSDEFLRQF